MAAPGSPFSVACTVYPPLPLGSYALQGMSWDVDAEQLRGHASTAFGTVLAVEVDPSESGDLTWCDCTV